MNQLTTIAALPEGGGCRAALPAEVAPVVPKPVELAPFELLIRDIVGPGFGLPAPREIGGVA